MENTVDLKKILYLAVHEINYGWGAEHFVNKGFIASGVKTVCIDFRKLRKTIVNQIKEVESFDYFLLQRGDNFPIKILKAINRPKFFWASELVSRNRDQDRLFKSNLFDHVFVRTIACKETIVSKGWLKEDCISIMLSGFDPETHYPLPNSEKDIDVLFIGNVLNRRKIWLHEIRKHCALTIADGVYGEEMVKLINRSKIILNIHSEDFLDTETRVFEVLGCKGFLLSEKLSIENPFKDRLHFVECTDLPDMITQTKYYLNNEIQINRIAEQGYLEALANHTYQKRAEHISELFSLYSYPNNTEAINMKMLNASKLESFILFLYDYCIGKVQNIRQRVKQIIKL